MVLLSKTICIANTILLVGKDMYLKQMDNFNQQQVRPENQLPKLKSIEGQQLDLHFAHGEARQPKSHNSRSRGISWVQ